MTSSVKITCDCGTIVNKRGLSSHKKTHKHMWRMEAKGVGGEEDDATYNQDDCRM